MTQPRIFICAGNEAIACAYARRNNIALSDWCFLFRHEQLALVDEATVHFGALAYDCPEFSKIRSVIKAANKYGRCIEEIGNFWDKKQGEAA